MAERLQRLWGTILDLIGIDRSPPWLGEYETSNKVQRALSHVVIQDGQNSRLVKGTVDGAVHVATPRGVAGLAVVPSALVTIPMTAAIPPDDTDSVDESESVWIDLGDARPRCVELGGPWAGTDQFVDLYQHATVESPGIWLGTCTPAAPLFVYTDLRYLSVGSVAGDNFEVWRAWKLT